MPQLSLVFWTGRGGGLTQLSSPSSSDCLPGDAPCRGMTIDAFVGTHRRAAPCGLTKCFGLCFGDGPAAVLGLQRGVVHAAQIDLSTGPRRVDRARSDPEPHPTLACRCLRGHPCALGSTNNIRPTTCQLHVTMARHPEYLPQQQLSCRSLPDWKLIPARDERVSLCGNIRPTSAHLTRHHHGYDSIAGCWRL